MESASRLEITFKSGDTITYREGEWDDYGYDKNLYPSLRL